MKHRVAALFLTLCLLQCRFFAFGTGAVPTGRDSATEAITASSAVVAAASSANATNATTVCNEEQLADWLDDHYRGSGAVKLGADIEITRMLDIIPADGERITIDTGEFGLKLMGGAVFTDANPNAAIEGEGVRVPVVDVYSVNNARMGNWNNLTQELHITARGKNGAGGCALKISSTATPEELEHWGEDYVERSFDLGMLVRQGKIKALGENAIGLWLDIEADAHCYNIEVDGKNAAAVYAPRGANVYYSRLSASGDAAAVADGAGLPVHLDTCESSPRPTGVGITRVERKFLDAPENIKYLPIRMGAEKDGFDLLLREFPAMLLSGSEAFPETARVFATLWDKSTFDAIDENILGETIINGEMAEPLKGLGLDDAAGFRLLVEVRDPKIPCISLMDFNSDERGDFVWLEYWEESESDGEKLSLLSSVDGGATWRDSTNDPNVLWDRASSEFRFYYGDEKSVMFQLVSGRGESNVAMMRTDLAFPLGTTGGDRTGTDRGGSGTQEPGGPDGDKTGGDSGDTAETVTGGESGRKNNEGRPAARAERDATKPVDSAPEIQEPQTESAGDTSPRPTPAPDGNPVTSGGYTGTSPAEDLGGEAPENAEKPQVQRAYDPPRPDAPPEVAARKTTEPQAKPPVQDTGGATAAAAGVAAGAGLVAAIKLLRPRFKL